MNALLTDIAAVCIILSIAAVLAFAGMVALIWRAPMHDPGPRHPARRALVAEVGDDTLVMLAEPRE